jgi:hypothetical protein
MLEDEPAAGEFWRRRGVRRPAPVIELLFLSFTTLSGVGLSDILPVLPMARALVMIEETAE